MNISDEAVEAAAKVFRAGSWHRSSEATCREILEAAAPILMAQAWNLGLTAGIRATRGNADPNPYQPNESSGSAGAGE